MNEHLAFLADWGNGELDFTRPGATTHFVVVALLLKPDQLAPLEAQLQPLCPLAAAVDRDEADLASGLGPGVVVA